MTDFFTRIFGEIAADIRRELVEIGWSGRAEPRHFGSPDRALDETLDPEKLGERGFLGWLQADHNHDQAREPLQPDHDHDFNR